MNYLLFESIGGLVIWAISGFKTTYKQSKESPNAFAIGFSFISVSILVAYILDTYFKK